MTAANQPRHARSSKLTDNGLIINVVAKKPIKTKEELQRSMGQMGKSTNSATNISHVLLKPDLNDTVSRTKPLLRETLFCTMPIWPHGETRWCDHHTVVILFICRDKDVGLRCGKINKNKHRRFLPDAKFSFQST